MGKRTVLEAKVVDIEKRREPSKHYVYVIEVTWSDGSVNVVYRRYSQFFDLQCKLLDKFQLEAGMIDPTDRILPFIPGKILFGRSHIREVALKRREPLNGYCQALTRLPVKISECQEILKFFETDLDDINPMDNSKSKSAVKGEKISAPRQLEQYVAVADYEKDQSNEVSLYAGMKVEIIEKNENGWWFVSAEEEQGWVPSTFLEREDGAEEKGAVRVAPGTEEKYLCTHDYNPDLSDEIKLEKGVIIDVKEKNLEGWWLIRSKDKEGWAPAAYLERVDTRRRMRLQATQPSQPVETITNMMEITTLKNITDQSAGSGHQISSSNENALNKFRYVKGQEGHVTCESEEAGNKLGRKSSPQLGQLKHIVPRKQSVKRKPARPPPPSRKSLYKTTEDFSDKVPNTLSFKKGQQAEVIEKNTSGWWYVKMGEREGWVPTGCLTRITMDTVEPHNVESANAHSVNEEKNFQQLKADLTSKFKKDNSSDNQKINENHSLDDAPVFVAVSDFQAGDSGELSLVLGQEVKVIERNENGWWLVISAVSDKGWVPSTYLQEVTSSAHTYSNVDIVKNLSDSKAVSSILNSEDSTRSPGNDVKVKKSAAESPSVHSLLKNNNSEVSTSKAKFKKDFSTTKAAAKGDEFTDQPSLVKPSDFKTKLNSVVGSKPKVSSAKPKFGLAQKHGEKFTSAPKKSAPPKLPEKPKPSQSIGQEEIEENGHANVSKLKNLFE